MTKMDCCHLEKKVVAAASYSISCAPWDHFLSDKITVATIDSDGIALRKTFVVIVVLKG